MHNRVAIITGAGRGIGKAIALELASRGYRLALAARTRRDIEAVAAEARTATAIPTDMTKWEDVQHLVDKTLASYGRIDVIVNNAGLAPVADVEQLSIEQWHAVLNTNLSSAFYLVKAVWPTFKQ